MAEPAWYESYKPAQTSPAGTVVQPGSPVLERRVKAQTAKDEAEAAVAPALANARLTEVQLAADAAARKKAKDDAAAAEGAEKAKLASLKASEDAEMLLQAIDEAKSKVGMWSTGVPGQILQGVWGTDSAELKNALKAVLGPKVLTLMAQMKAQSKTGATGFGQLAIPELRLLENAYNSISQGNDPDTLIQNLDEMAFRVRRGTAIAQGYDPNDPQVAAALGYGEPDAAVPTPTEPTPGTMERNVALRGLNNRIAGLIKSGASEDQIRSYVDEIVPGMGPKLQNLPQAIEYAKRYPNRPLRVNVEDMYKGPAEGVAGAIAEEFNNPVGAGIVAGADAASFGTIDDLTGNPEETEMVMSGLRDKYKGPSVAGSLLGGAYSGYGLFRAARALGLGPGGASLASSVGGGALAGAGYAQEGDAGGGALTGATLGALLDVGARGAGRVIGGALTGATDPSVRTLLSRDIPLTPGQVTGDKQSLFNRFEQGLTSKWPISELVNARRREASEGFVRAAKQETVDPIRPYMRAGMTDEIGDTGVREVKDQIGDVFETSFDGRTLTPDLPFRQASANTLRRLRTDITNPLGAELADQLSTLTQRYLTNNQGSTGRDIQNYYREMAEVMSLPRYRDAVPATEMKQIADSFVSVVDQLVERQIPGAVAKYGSARDAWRRQVPFAEASRGARSTEGVFSPVQLATQADNAVINYGGRGQAQTGNVPFNELTEAGMAVLPSTINDSGTALRTQIGLGGLGAGFGAGVGVLGGNEDRNSPRDADGEGAVSGGLLGLGGALALMSPYTRSGSTAFREFMRPARSRTVLRAGQAAPAAGRALGAAYRPELIRAEAEDSRRPPPAAGPGKRRVPAGLPASGRRAAPALDVGDGFVELGGGVRYNGQTDEFIMPDGTVIPREDK